MEDFNSFKELYDFYKGVLNVNLTLEKSGNNYDVEKIIAALRQVGIDKFFDKINNNKIGKIINKEETNDLIMRTS